METTLFNEFNKHTGFADERKRKIEETLRVIDNQAFVQRDMYQQYEYDLMHMNIAVAVMQSYFNRQKTAFDKMFTLTYNVNKNQTKEVKNAKGETSIKEVTAADAKAMTEFQLLEEQVLLDGMENNLDLYKTYLN